MTLEQAMGELVSPLTLPDGTADESEDRNGTAARAGSVLSALRARAKVLREEQTVLLDIPGYDGMLCARYSAVNLGKVLSQAGDIVTPLNVDWTRAADTLGKALVELLMRDAPDGDTYPLFTDQPARYDDDTVAALGLVVTERSARAVLVALCGGGALGESRVWAHFMSYQSWLLGGLDGETPEAEVARDAVGE